MPPRPAAWAVRGAVGSIQINGGLSNTQIFAGANAGPDAILGTKDDSFAAGTIDSIFVGGAETSSTVAAGVAEHRATIFSRQVLLPKGRIGPITVRGAVDFGKPIHRHDAADTRGSGQSHRDRRR